MTPRKTASIAGAAFALYAAGAAAFAQPAAPPPPPGASDRMDRAEHRVMMFRDKDGRTTRFDSRMERRADPAAHLRAILQLKPGQEAALTAFLASTKPPAPQMTPANTPAPKTTPERLALAEKRLADRTSQARARLDATRKFYDQLDPGQKRAFDELAPMMGGRGDGDGPRMRVMMRHMPMPPMAPMAPPPPRS